jgi:hypothetical protein
MTYLKDIRLWLMCLATIVGTAAFGINVHGALGGPQTSGDPQPLPAVVQSLQAPSGASTSYGEN